MFEFSFIDNNLWTISNHYYRLIGQDALFLNSDFLSDDDDDYVDCVCTAVSVLKWCRVRLLVRPSVCPRGSVRGRSKVRGT